MFTVFGSGRRGRTSRLLLVLLFLGSLGIVGPLAATEPVGASPATTSVGPLPVVPAFDGNPCSEPPSADPTCPPYNSCLNLQSCTGDAPDPTIIRSGANYFAFTTGTALGNSLQVLESTSLTSGYHSTNRTTCVRSNVNPTTSIPCWARWGSSTFGPSGATGLPSWTDPGSQTSPSVAFVAGRWLMYYDTVNRATGRFCLAVARIDPRDQAPDGTILAPQFVTPPSGQTPLRCQPPPSYAQGVGLIDPSYFVDPATSTPYLLFKSNDGSGRGIPAFLFVQQLSSDGLHLVGFAHELLTNDTARHPWERTVENPDMVRVNGGYALLFSGGSWNRADYAEGIATCATPIGPCTQPSGPLLTSYPQANPAVAGPGGGSIYTTPGGTHFLVYAGWNGSCIGYPNGSRPTIPAGCTTGARHLFVTKIDMG